MWKLSWSSTVLTVCGIMLRGARHFRTRSQRPVMLSWRAWMWNVMTCLNSWKPRGTRSNQRKPDWSSSDPLSPHRSGGTVLLLKGPSWFGAPDGMCMFLLGSALSSNILWPLQFLVPHYVTDPVSWFLTDSQLCPSNEFGYLLLFNYCNIRKLT